MCSFGCCAGRFHVPLFHVVVQFQKARMLHEIIYDFQVSMEFRTFSLLFLSISFLRIGSYFSFHLVARLDFSCARVSIRVALKQWGTETFCPFRAVPKITARNWIKQSDFIFQWAHSAYFMDYRATEVYAVSLSFSRLTVADCATREQRKMTKSTATLASYGRIAAIAAQHKAQLCRNNFFSGLGFSSEWVVRVLIKNRRTKSAHRITQ